MSAKDIRQLAAHARTLDPRSTEGAALARGAAAVIVTLAERRFPYARFAVNAVRGVLDSTVGLITGECSEAYPTGDRVSGACAAAGAAVDIVFALLAEDKYRRHVHHDGGCAFRAGQLRFDTAPGAADPCEPRSLDIPCSIHGTPAGTPCPIVMKLEGS